MKRIKSKNSLPLFLSLNAGGMMNDFKHLWDLNRVDSWMYIFRTNPLQMITFYTILKPIIAQRTVELNPNNNGENGRRH